jgi:hypothetical protein
MELLRATDVTATRSSVRPHVISRPAVNWKQGRTVSIAGSVSDDAKQVFRDWKAPKPCVGLVSQRS